MPSLVSTAPNTKAQPRLMPPGSWDTHHHIFDLDRFPLASTRHFTPDSAPLSALEVFHHDLGIDHPALAHGLSFGRDLSSLEFYLEYFEGSARAYGVIELESVTDEELERLYKTGITGIRIDFHLHKCQHDVELQKKFIKAYTERVAGRLSGVQVYSPHPEFWEELTPIVLNSPVPIVLDHFGGLRTPSLVSFLAKTRGSSTTTAFETLSQPGLSAIKALFKSGRLYIKLSAPYRVSEDPTYADMEPLVRELVEANPERVLYGSDWPHTQPFHRRPKDLKPEDTETFVDFDDRAWVERLKGWLTEQQWQLLLVENPRRLFEYTKND
ncbi:hypothetical protein BCR35DRAFT_321341 [Leucosporidium creatinivorum]|uniref:Amidohydrolase-related domain-containing protein n=1 Tax=Leucosporidium creatinivorum TaxID=106004 RepID=A0A1Y2FD15_9BASI|nr:hypothetical protein BCR35DRAFT_321341 [Leucosporidium creatinivorum]